MAARLADTESAIAGDLRARMRCFYASDFHGSDVCWRKFLNAGRFYKADALVMGGDLVGKAVLPIVMRDGSQVEARATYLGRNEVLAGEQALAEFEQLVRDSGFYPARLSSDEHERLERDEAARGTLFELTVRAELQRWLDMAVERTNPNIGVFVMAGNDDPWFVDELLGDCPAVTFCDNRVLDVCGHEMISLSYSNRTPWDSPRELDEPDLHDRLIELAGRLSNCETAIFNLHAPPYGSGLDDAPILDADLRPMTRMGQVETGPVGSTAVRQLIEEYQPLISLHGHIHESRGITQIGRTTAINPGSEYTSGCIHGALFETKRGNLKSRQLVIG